LEFKQKPRKWKFPGFFYDQNQVPCLAGMVTVVYSIKPGYVINEAQVYVGCEKYPMIKGKPTVALGQYTFTASNLDKATGLTVNFTGSIWLVLLQLLKHH
jgi:hypothetical protein